MAARLRRRHDDATRAAIQTKQLVNRLTEHALGDKEIMSASQIQAARILLAKTLPDLRAVELAGPEGGGPSRLVVSFVSPDGTTT